MDLPTEFPKIRSAPAGGRKIMHYRDPSPLRGPRSLTFVHRLPLGARAGRGRIASVFCRNDRPFRADLVARIRREIAAGTYETPEKWAAAFAALVLDAS
jgi:hypothetical protein